MGAALYAWHSHAGWVTFTPASGQAYGALRFGLEGPVTLPASLSSLALSGGPHDRRFFSGILAQVAQGRALFPDLSGGLEFGVHTLPLLRSAKLVCSVPVQS